MRKLLLGVALLFVASFASAQDSKFYAGGHIGQSHAKSTCDTFAGTTVSCDDKDTAWKVLGGYQFIPYFAAEIAYTDLGEVRAIGPGGVATAKSNAFELVGLGTLPISDKFLVYGKLGVYRAKVDASVSTTTLSGSASSTNNDLTYGIGAGFNVSRRVTVRAEWQRYNDVGGSSTGKDDVDVLSIGVLFHF